MEQEKIHASKIPFNKNLPTALFIIRDDGGCGYYRCLQPAMFLRRSGLFNTITDMNTTTREHILQADIVIFQSTGTPESVEAFNFALENKKPVVVEVDDLLHLVSPNNPGYATWNPATLYVHRATYQMNLATAMTVSTPQLAREYFPFNKNIYVLPNYLNKEKWEQYQSKKKDGYIRIGWAGGNAHIDDLRLIAPVIKKVVHEYKDKVKFETMGMTKAELKGCFDLEEFDSTCPKCNYQGNYIAHPGESLDDYPLILATFGWDIALAPVVNTGFNNAKSDLKLKEYSAIGYPMVASRVTPYIEAQKSGCAVDLADSFEEWYNKIKTLIDDAALREERFRQNKEWVSQYWIDYNVKRYAETYLQIININK